MLGLMLRDLLLQKKGLFLSLLLAVVLFPISSKINIMPHVETVFGPVLVLFLFSFSICFGSFMLDEKEHTDIIINSFAFDRKKIVIARYFLAVLTILVFTLIGILSTVIYSTIIGNAWNEHLIAYAIGPLVAFLMLFIAFPIYFKMGGIGGQKLAFLAYFAISFGLPYVFRQSMAVFIKIDSSSVLSFIDTSLVKILFFAYLFICSFGVLSVCISILFYRRREF